MINPNDFDPPPSDGYWPMRFLVNAEYVDTLTTSWRTIPNSDGIRARRNTAGDLLLRDPDLTVFTFTLTAATYPEPEIPIYICERQ